MKLLIALSLLLVIDVPQVKKELQAIATQQQAKAWLSKSGLKGNLMELDEIKDSSAVALKLFKSKTGDILEQSSPDKSTTYLYKLLSVKESEVDRVQYIFFDINKRTKKQIDSLRAVVMKRLKGGETFAALAKQYSMDPNGKRGGDLGWYNREMMAAGFVSAVRAHAKGDVFPLDLPEEKWYYVVHKSHNPVKAKKIVAVYVAVPSK